MMRYMKLESKNKGNSRGVPGTPEPEDSLFNSIDKKLWNLEKNQELLGDKLSERDITMGIQSKRLDAIESQIETSRVCKQESVIEDLKTTVHDLLELSRNEIAKTASIESKTEDNANRIERLKEDTKARNAEHKKNWRVSVTAVVSSAVFILSAIGGSIWYIAQLDERVSQQNKNQIEATGRVEDQVQKIDSRMRSNVSALNNNRNAIERLARAVEESNGYETVDNWCSSLSDREVRLIKLSIPSENWPNCDRIHR